MTKDVFVSISGMHEEIAETLQLKGTRQKRSKL